MAQTVVVKLTDDLDGSDAVRTVSYSLDGKSYEIDLSEKNVERLQKALQPFIEKSRGAGKAFGARRSNSRSLFSQLDPAEKERFRAWAGLPTARRITDRRVQSWIDAGKP
jgi:hypothetical protein